MEAAQPATWLLLGLDYWTWTATILVLFVDWPVLDRHKRVLAARLDCYVDLTDAGSPRSLDGAGIYRVGGHPHSLTFVPETSAPDVKCRQH